MKLKIIKKGKSLLPFDAESEAYMGKIKEGEMVVVDMVKPRNNKLHRKYFALLGTIAEQLDIETEDVHDYIKDKLGMYDVAILGEMVIKRYHSISLSSMDGYEFEKYFEKSVRVVATLLSVDYATLLNELTAGYEI